MLLYGDVGFCIYHRYGAYIELAFLLSRFRQEHEQQQQQQSQGQSAHERALQLCDEICTQLPRLDNILAGDSGVGGGGGGGGYSPLSRVIFAHILTLRGHISYYLQASALVQSRQAYLTALTLIQQLHTFKTLPTSTTQQQQQQQQRKPQGAATSATIQQLFASGRAASVPSAAASPFARMLLDPYVYIHLGQLFFARGEYLSALECFAILVQSPRSIYAASASTAPSSNSTTTTTTTTTSSFLTCYLGLTLSYLQQYALSERMLALAITINEANSLAHAIHLINLFRREAAAAAGSSGSSNGSGSGSRLSASSRAEIELSYRALLQSVEASSAPLTLSPALACILSSSLSLWEELGRLFFQHACYVQAESCLTRALLFVQAYLAGLRTHTHTANANATAGRTQQQQQHHSLLQQYEGAEVSLREKLAYLQQYKRGVVPPESHYAVQIQRIMRGKLTRKKMAQSRLATHLATATARAAAAATHAAQPASMSKWKKTVRPA